MARRAAYRLPADQDRFTLGVALTRTVLGALLGVVPEEVKLDRSCPDCGKPHGRPRLLSGADTGPGTGIGIGSSVATGTGPGAGTGSRASLAEGELAFSVSHSGDVVGVAFTGAPAVGLDVEQINPARAQGLAASALSATERQDFERVHPDHRGSAFFRYWVRKEAVLKATSEGLRVPLQDLTVSGADQPPRVLGWVGRPDAPARFTLRDLDARPGHAASVAVIGARPAIPEVREYDASALLG